MAFLQRKDVMLAYPAEEKRILRFPRITQEDGNSLSQFFHQPKFNGERCRLEWFHGEPVLISSYGNEFSFLSTIKDQLIKLAKEIPIMPFDGEIYVHGWPRERIDSALRRKVNKSSEVDELQFCIFDYQNYEEYQWQRFHTLGIVESAIKALGLPNLQVVEYGVCSIENWLTHAENYCEDGYEGIILRNPFGLYEAKRTTNLLKFKPTEQDEYTIIDVNEAISLEGDPKGMVGSFLVQATNEPDSAVFNVGAGKIKHGQRVYYWGIRHKLPGKILIVKHELLKTSGMVPIACVAVSVKE